MKKATKRRARAGQFRLWAAPKKPTAVWPKGSDGKPARVGVILGGDGWWLGPGDAFDEDELPDVQALFRNEFGAMVFEKERAT